MAFCVVSHDPVADCKELDLMDEPSEEESDVQTEEESEPTGQKEDKPVILKSVLKDLRKS